MINYLFLLVLGGFAALGGSSSGSGATPGASGAAPEPEPEPSDPGVQDDPVPADGGDAPMQSDVPLGQSSGGDSGMPVLPASAYDIGWSGLSAEEQMIVELVNRARLDPLDEVARQGEGLAAGVSITAVEALAVVRGLSDASENHSEDMDNRDFFSHTNPDGDGPGDRAIDSGYGSRFVGENIGWVGSTRAPTDVQDRAEGHHANLWESDGHQQNLMNERWSEIGVGYDYGDYLGYNGSTFVTEMFGDKGQTFLTGVVIDDEDGDEFYDVGEGQGDVRITAFDGEDAYATATWDAGGYSLALPAGTYRVVFEGGELDQPYETEVTIGSENVKLDVIEESGNVITSVRAGMVEDDLLSALTLSSAAEDAVVMVDDEEPELMLF